MGFLIDINQIDRTGIDYALNLFDDTVISSTGGVITGSLIVSNTGLFSVLGDICTESGVIFDCENRRIGVGVIPECSIHIKDLYLNNQNPENEAVVELLTYGQNMSGVIKSDNRGNLNIEGSTEILFKGAGEESLLAVTRDTISGGAIVFDDNMEISGFEAISRNKAATVNTFKNDSVVRQQYYDCVTKGGGEMSWLISKSIGDTGYSINTGIYDVAGGGYWPTIEENGEDISVKIEAKNYGIFSAGKMIENTQDVKKQYFITGNDLYLLRLESGIENLYNFNYGNQFWIYIKTIGEYRPVDTSSIFGDLSNGIARSSNLSAIRWKLTQVFNNVEETSIRYDFQTMYMNLPKIIRTVGFDLDHGNKFGKNSIHLLGVVGLNAVPLNFLYKYDNISLNNENISNGTTLPGQDLGYSDSNTEILMQSGCLYEIGLIKRGISTEELIKIRTNGNLLDSMPNTGEIGFLFKVNAGSGNTVYDVINGYTGTIVNVNEGYWI